MNVDILYDLIHHNLTSVAEISTLPNGEGLDEIKRKILTNIVHKPEKLLRSCFAVWQSFTSGKDTGYESFVKDMLSYTIDSRRGVDEFKVLPIKFTEDVFSFMNSFLKTHLADELKTHSTLRAYLGSILSQRRKKKSFNFDPKVALFFDYDGQNLETVIFLIFFVFTLNL